MSLFAIAQWNDETLRQIGRALDANQTCGPLLDIAADDMETAMGRAESLAAMLERARELARRGHYPGMRMEEFDSSPHHPG